MSRPACFSKLQYCKEEIETSPEPVVALKDLGAEVSLINEVLKKDLNLPAVGAVFIRGVFGEPAQARLVVLNIKPYTGPG